MGSQKLTVDAAALAGITQGPLPASRKVYLQGTLHPDVRVPVREISQTPTRLGHGPDAQETPNPPVRVYDASGPYTDPGASIDLRAGLPPARRSWTLAHGDVEERTRLSSLSGRQHEEDGRLAGLRFPHRRRPLVAKPGRNVTQLHYARAGIITEEMEAVALRENLNCDASLS